LNNLGEIVPPQSDFDYTGSSPILHKKEHRLTLKLTKRRATSLKRDIAAGTKSLQALANKYKVSRGLVSDIANERTRTDVPWPEDYEPALNKKGGQRKKILHDPTDARVLELEAEVIHLNDEKNLLKRQAKAATKTSGLYKAACDVVSENLIPMKALPVQRKRGAQQDIIEEDLVLHLSDGHHDQVVRKEETGDLEEYNFPISCARAERLVDTVIEHSQGHLPNYRFRRLWILANGDHTSGEIHGHEKRSYFKNQMKNTLAIGQLHALMIRDLAPYFDQVNCVYTPGNHGRRTLKKDHYGAHENWDYMVAKVTELHCAKLRNVAFKIPNAFSVNLDICGHGFHLCHGDDVKGSLGIPFYGMVRKQKNLMALNAISGGTRIRYFCMGHHHVQASMADLDGELLVNGAWLGNDPYSYNSFSGYRAPTQLLHGVHKKHGVTWRLPIGLKHDAESKGPKRYKVSI